MAELMRPEPDAVMLAARVLIAALLGAALGLEREWRGKEAGLRTNTLIAIGAALFGALSITLGGDPARIAAQVVTGIGFIGAGCIIQERGRVVGLTTAATIWVVAAIGIIAGAGFPIIAFIASSMVLLTLIVLGSVEKQFLDPDAP